uniref:Uncharacterized protein n=1 Tax=Triticum urartu TaxID=4572 RepID=A0A8R7V7P7_TRIUA
MSIFPLLFAFPLLRCWRRLTVLPMITHFLLWVCLLATYGIIIRCISILLLPNVIGTNSELFQSSSRPAATTTSTASITITDPSTSGSTAAPSSTTTTSSSTSCARASTSLVSSIFSLITILEENLLDYIDRNNDIHSWSDLQTAICSPNVASC